MHLVDMILREGYSISVSLISVRLASSIKHQSSLARLPAERTKVVTMGAPLNKYGFVMSLWSIVLSPANGCNVCFTCRSKVDDSSVSSQK